MKRKRDIASFFTTVSKEKCRQREDEDNRAEEQDEREEEEMVREEADIETSETEAFNPESEEEDVGCEGESEEQKGQPVDPPSHLSSSQPSDISKCKDDQPVQPNLKMFPTTVMADRRRSFQASWYESHPWVEYSAIMDSAYCYACRHFSPPSISGSVFDSPSGSKLVKTYLRSTITDERLSSLGMLSIESRRAKALDLDAFVNYFARNHKRRILLL